MHSRFALRYAVWANCVGILGVQGTNKMCPHDYHSSSQDEDWTKFGSKCYRDATAEWGPRFWEFCSITCRDLYCDDGYCVTARLVTVESPEEQSFLEKQFPSDPSCCGPASSGKSCCKWIGLGWISEDRKSHGVSPASANEAGGSWAWQSGKISTYRNWAAGEPQRNEGCAVLGHASDSQQSSGWVAKACQQEDPQNKHGCLCEISLEPVSTTTTTVHTETVSFAKRSWCSGVIVFMFAFCGLRV